MIGWLARRRQRREAARWARIEAEAAKLAGPLGQDAARRRYGEAVGGSGARPVSQERPALSPVLARPTPVPDGRVSAEGWAP